MNLNSRQEKILNYLKHNQDVSGKQILQHLEEKGDSVSRMTLNRDVNSLEQDGLVTQSGNTKQARYSLAPNKKGHRPYDVEKYYSIPQDGREVIEQFSTDVFGLFSHVFSQQELDIIDDATEKYRKKVKKLSTIDLKKEIERLTIDLSWKSSQIEGNTYGLLDTEQLIKENKKAEGHSDHEAVMILNHKYTLDYLFDVRTFAHPTKKQAFDIHALLTKNLDIINDYRDRGVGITGTNYRPLDNRVELQGALEQALQVLDNLNHPVERAFAAVVLFSYMQVFADGNKRTARMIGNAILISENLCPLSYRSVDEKDYKKAMLLFYEQHSFVSFKELFLEQYLFAAKTYF